MTQGLVVKTREGGDQTEGVGGGGQKEEGRAGSEEGEEAQRRQQPEQRGGGRGAGTGADDLAGQVNEEQEGQERAEGGSWCQ